MYLPGKIHLQTGGLVLISEPRFLLGGGSHSSLNRIPPHQTGFSFTWVSFGSLFKFHLSEPWFESHLGLGSHVLIDSKFPYSNFPVQISLFKFPYSKFPIQISLFKFPYSNFPIQISLVKFPYSNFTLIVILSSNLTLALVRTFCACSQFLSMGSFKIHLSEPWFKSYLGLGYHVLLSI